MENFEDEHDIYEMIENRKQKKDEKKNINIEKELNFLKINKPEKIETEINNDIIDKVPVFGNISTINNVTINIYYKN